MSEFRLDTSGAVLTVSLEGLDGTARYEAETYGKRLHWSDLSPFEEGYVEAMFASDQREIGTTVYYSNEQQERRDARFSDLAPETLSAILKDCAAFEKKMGTSGKFAGKMFWEARRDPVHPEGAKGGNRYWDIVAGFPPLRPYLGDDGRVYLREVA